MFKRLLARLFGRKPAPATTSIKVVPPVIGVVTGYQPRAAATPSHPPRKPSQGNGTNVNARVVAFSSRQTSRRDDISDPLHPLNPLNPLNPVSPIYVDTTTLGDSCRSETIAFGGSSHHHHHSSSHDSGSYDSGSYDSGSSSSSCD